MTQQQTRPALPSTYPPKKQRPLWFRIALGVAIALAVSGLAWAWPSLTSPTTHTVVYTVSADTAYGSGRTGTVTMQTDNGTSQSSGLLPATATFTQFNTGDFVYVSVQNGQGLGSVTCRVTVDGVLVSENTSSGGYTIATCQGSVPR